MSKTFVLLLWTLVLLASWNSAAETHFSLDGVLRSRPQSFNIVGTMAQDGILWGAPTSQNPFYGYYRIGGRLGGSPTAAAFIQVAPVAPLVFEIQKSRTDRFLKSSYFDCKTNECLGQIERLDTSARLAGAYQNWLLVSSFLWREIQTSPSRIPVGLELESLIVPSGKHRYFENSILLGHRWPEKKMAGLLLIRGEISQERLQSDALYAIYRFPYQNFNISTGAGSYRSSHQNLNGLSLFFAAGLNWGEKLSLF